MYPYDILLEGLSVEHCLVFQTTSDPPRRRGDMGYYEPYYSQILSKVRCPERAPVTVAGRAAGWGCSRERGHDGPHAGHQGHKDPQRVCWL